MGKRLRFAMVAVAALAALAGQVLAHEAGPGPHGGPRVDAGAYHAELVVDGSTTVTVYLSDVADKPVATTGFKANAIFVVGSQTVRFTLAPAEGVKLVGTAPSPVPAGAKGAVQITAPDGATAQAKF